MAAFPKNRPAQRGVALLMVLMIILGLLVLGQLAMLMLDNVAQRSGTYRRQEQGGYCAEEGLNLGRAALLSAMNGGSSLNPAVLNNLLADPTDPISLTAHDLCQVPVTPGTPGLATLCRTDASGNNLYRVNLIDDIDEVPGSATNPLNPFHDSNQVFFLRSECLSQAAKVTPTPGSTQWPAEDVALVEVNQAGQSNCYGQSGNSAGCGGQ